MTDKLLHSCKTFYDKTKLINYEAVSIKCHVFVFVALLTQHAIRMRRVILSSVAFSAVPVFSHYLIKGKIF